MIFEDIILKSITINIEKFFKQNAFCINEVFYNYESFWSAISNIRSALRLSCLSNNRIGLVANDDLETYASVFALWYEGLAYVPLHPKAPYERNVDIINQAGVSLIIDTSSLTKYGVIKKIINPKALPRQTFDFTVKEYDDETLAYILFTSGSTGKPKGVPISRKNVGSFMKSFWEVGFKITEDDRCLQCFDLTFDVSIQSLLVPITRFACVYTVPHDQIKYSYVFGLLDEHKLTFGAMPPSMIRYFRPYLDEINIPSMRYNILTAEASPVDLITEWSKCLPNAEIFDFYGPTEATIYCTYNKFNRQIENKQYSGLLSIGKPMLGFDAIIIDEGGKILGPNEKGELCISGVQLTSGYWGNPEKTKESFIEKEWNETASRFYKTGDNCFFDNEGDILFIGRLDNQVKIQGFRIELGEIEYQAREFLNGKNAIAIDFENTGGLLEIALFLEGADIDTKHIREFLQTKLPEYMIPAKFIIEEAFPLNANGKVDRLVLKQKVYGC